MDFDWLELLRNTSRSFVVGIQALRSPLDERVGLSYLLCRLLDTYEDSTQVPAEIRRAGMRRSHALLEGMKDPAFDPAPLLSDWSAIQKLGDPIWNGVNPWELKILDQAPALWTRIYRFPIEDRRAIARAVGLMLEGMLVEIEHGASTRTRSQVDKYCFYVAGTVGILLNHLFQGALGTKAERELMEEDAVSFGKALQLVNIIKDFHQDWREGRCFWPGIEPPSEKTISPSVQKLRTSFAELRQLFQDHRVPAERYLERIRAHAVSRPDIYFFCAFPFRVACLTFDLATRASDWLENPASVLKIPRELTERVISELGSECDALEAPARA